jgi:lipopolysaccharide biosynthesis glycosyltransferase
MKILGIMIFLVILSGCYNKPTDIFSDVPDIIYETPEQLFADYNKITSDKNIDKNSLRKRLLALWDKAALLHNYSGKTSWIKMYVDSVYRSIQNGAENSEVLDIYIQEPDSKKRYTSTEGFNLYSFILLEKGHPVTVVEFTHTTKTQGKLYKYTMFLYLINDNGYKIVTEATDVP